MRRVQEGHLQHFQEQEENQGKAGAPQALRFLQEAHQAFRDEGKVISENISGIQVSFLF